MDYINKILESGFGENPLYPQNDIGIAQLFYDLHKGAVLYVSEAKSWYAYDGKRWDRDDGGFKTMERCKAFVTAFGEYAIQSHADDGEFLKWAGKLTGRRNREGILRDAMSIAPVSIAVFDRDALLLNVNNGTLNLRNFTLQKHNPADMITKLAPVRYDAKAKCARWDRFIDEVTCGEKELALYLQKAAGYSLTGLTEYEQFYILYGEKTRNGKTTLIETIAAILGDYSRNTQAQSLSRRSIDGSAATPDMARLKGARLVTVPEPEKGLELNIALIKQLTGGDTYTARFLNANPFEFKPEFKLFIKAKHKKAYSLFHRLTEGIFPQSDFPFDFHVLARGADNGDYTVHDLPLVVKIRVVPIGKALGYLGYPCGGQLGGRHTGDLQYK
jgi:putative DNA primase/helicase